MDKGIIIGAEHEAATRMNLSFVMFRHVTSVCLSSITLWIVLMQVTSRIYSFTTSSGST